MRVSVARLEEYLGSPLAVDAVVERLTMAGLEVDAVDAGKTVEGVVVGRVTYADKHPDADKLKVCKVDFGAGEPADVVCGAPNVRVGLLAPFAKEGARLGELKIKRARIRGVESRGMLCSAAELGLGEDAGGLLELDVGAPGDDLRKHLRLGDACLRLDLTPNRSDCFSVRGVARELAALDGKTPAWPAPPKRKAAKGGDYTVDVREPRACPRYLACVVNNVADMQTPLWIRERLQTGGMQAVHPLVDILNMWMLEIGQPMHAFDLDKLNGALTVRYASPGEKMTALGGETLTLPGDCLVVADDEGAVAAAGIIGGARAAVTAETRNALLECAFFSPEAIAGRARTMRLHTEASLRFERGVDPELQDEAMARATATLAEAAPGAKIGPVCARRFDAHLPGRAPIEVTQAAMERALGVALDLASLRARLEASGCTVKVRKAAKAKANISCTPPSWRFDLQVAADLIEEAGRFYGYDRIPVTAASKAGAPTQAAGERLSDALCALGYLEVVNLSFGDARAMAVFSDETPLTLDNPIAPELSAMRTSLWPGLIHNLRHNLNRDRDAVRLFECARTYGPDGDRSAVIAGLAYGRVAPEQWGAPTRQCDFFDLKGDIEMLFRVAPSFEPGVRKGLHPGQTAVIQVDGEELGCMGALSPANEEALDVPGGVFLFELRVDAERFGKPLESGKISKYPSIRNDISFVVQDETLVGALVAHIEAMGVADLQQTLIFDIFRGGDIGQDKKSVSLCLIYRSFYSTLNGEEVAKRTQAIVESLRQTFNAEPRE